MLHRSRLSLATVVVASLLGAALAPALRPVYAPGPDDVTAASPQDGGRGDGSDDERRGSDDSQDDAPRSRTARIAALTESFRGAWRLVSMQPAPPAAAYLQVNGVLLVDEHLLSLIAQARPDPVRTRRTQDVVQSGVYYWRIGPQLTLEMASVLGHHNASESGAIEGVPAFEPREYEISILGRRLVLSKRDGTRLEFDRFDVNAFPPEASRYIDALRTGRDLDELRDR